MTRERFKIKTAAPSTRPWWVAMSSMWAAIILTAGSAVVGAANLAGLIEEFSPWRLVVVIASGLLVAIYAPSIFYLLQLRRRHKSNRTH